MAINVLAAVDGTGPFSDQVYETTFQSSHVSKLCNSNSFQKSFRRRGPSADGVKTDNKARELLTEILDFKAGQAGDVDIFLTGYSRGGAAVIHLAHLLKEKGIPVRAMYLFDAVDRTLERFNTTIPRNVEVCYHALRDPKANSRKWFDNCGTKASVSTTRMLMKNFFGTHGAIGGLPQTKTDDKGFVIEELPEQHPVIRQVAQAMPGFVALGSMAYDALQDRKVDQTAVTAPQNQMASNDVWNWMCSNVMWQSQQPMVLPARDFERAFV